MASSIQRLTYPPQYPSKLAQQRTSLDRDPGTRTDESFNQSASQDHTPIRQTHMEGPRDSQEHSEHSYPSSNGSMRHATQPSQHTHHHPYSLDALPKELPALQVNGVLEDPDDLNPIGGEDNPGSYDLVDPITSETPSLSYSLESRSQTLFSREHLQVIFADPTLLFKFTSFLTIHRPQSMALLIYYLDALKALRTLHYANAILAGLDPIADQDFTFQPVAPTTNPALEARANGAFEELVKEELPAYITHQYIQIVSSSISSRITGSLAPHLRERSEGLAEVFCLTDPGRLDNPIVFTSEEFHRTTQYGTTYVLGRNCRFLQGPWTNPLSVRRLRDAIAAGRQHQEVFLNYRRDGSPFMNLLMIAPLCDSRGKIRYFLGAQVDVSGLVKECVELESLQRLLEMQARGEEAPSLDRPDPGKGDELRELAEMMGQGELSTIRKWGGRMHREVLTDDDAESTREGLKRLTIRDPNTLTTPLASAINGAVNASGRLSGVYQHYLLVRPYPSLRILFASPSQRVPGILQCPFLNKIGGSSRVRDELAGAFAEGRGVTAKVRWVSGKPAAEGAEEEKGRNKWIHCTPLVGARGDVGVWMVVIVDDEREKEEGRWRDGGGRMAPPMASSIGPQERAMLDQELEASRLPGKRNGVAMGGSDADRTGSDVNRTGSDMNRTGSDVNRTGSDVNRTVNGNGGEGWTKGPDVNGHANGERYSKWAGANEPSTGNGNAFVYAQEGGVYERTYQRLSGIGIGNGIAGSQRGASSGGSQRGASSVGSQSVTSLRID